jgi:glycosyltransferase involved in cell wall biosynthesis
MPKISVIVPVYNVEKYLHECINSILSQTFTDFEIILVNDGSQDSSGMICDEYASKDNRITVIHQENQGQAAARNKALTIAKGEWIHFVDSDDLIHPQMLEVLYGAVDENTQISMCGLIKGIDLTDDFFSPKNDCNFKKSPINEEELILIYRDEYQYWIACAKLIKKTIIEKYPFTVGKIHEDSAVAFKWINETEFVNITDEQLYFYRTNPNSTTQTDFSLKNLDVLWAIEEQIKFYENTDFNKIKKMVYDNYAVVCAKMYYRLLENQEWTEEAKKLKKKLRTFIQKKRRFINFNKDWVFNMVYGIIYPKPIRAIFRLKRYIKNRKR